PNPQIYRPVNQVIPCKETPQKPGQTISIRENIQAQVSGYNKLRANVGVRGLLYQVGSLVGMVPPIQISSGRT
ncbi:MAG: hypothetical protein AAFV07_07500, partial [Bacteroidota bacterium]